MDYYKIYPTNKAKIDRIKELENKLAQSAAGASWDRDALEKKCSVLEKQLSDERLKNEALEMVGSDLKREKDECKILRETIKALHNDACRMRGEHDGLTRAIRTIIDEYRD